MVCIQCYLPPILFMIYMKFLNPFVAPILYPIFNKVVTYFWGPDALQTDAACPIRPKTKKTATAGQAESGGDGSEPSTSTASSKEKGD